MAKIINTDDYNADFVPDTHDGKPLHQYGAFRKGGGVDDQYVLRSLPSECNVAVVHATHIEFYSTSLLHEIRGSTPVVKGGGRKGQK